MNESFEARYLSGNALYGDDFDESAIRKWYDEEEHGYFELTKTYASYTYGYHALNEFLAFRYLDGPYDCCVAMGCAKGEDVAPLADRVDHFVAIEPAEQWWSENIGGRPAQYLKPTVMGDIPMRGESADLVICLGVLHHIPNVSHVFGEMARVLRPGGKMVVREPICSMGDWRRPRRGLTRNERGIPSGWIESRAQIHGLKTLRASPCHFPLTDRVAKMFGAKTYNSPALVRIDAGLSRLTQWNRHYHRDSIRKKFAPNEMSFLFENATTFAQEAPER